MARPQKNGLDYFTTDVNFYQDFKIRKLIRYKGAQAVTVYNYLLCQIYASGYYLEWDNEIPFIVFEATGLKESTIRGIITFCLSIGLFDKTMFDDNKVLTSHGIQKRFFAVCAAAKRRLSSEMPYLLVNIKGIKVSSEETKVIPEETIVTPEETDDNTEETPINSAKSTQRKVKKRKDNPTTCGYPRPHTHEEEHEPCSEEDRKAYDTVDAEVAELLRNPIWKEQVFTRFNFLMNNDQTLLELLNRWVGEVKSRNKRHINLGDAKDHFVSWLIIQERENNKSNHNYGTVNNNGYRSREDMLRGTVKVMSELRAEGDQFTKPLPIV